MEVESGNELIRSEVTWGFILSTPFIILVVSINYFIDTKFIDAIYYNSFFLLNK